MDLQKLNEALPSALQQANVVGCSGHKEPTYDRYLQTAYLLCGYFKIPSERVEDLADIIRKRADQEKPYELVHCQKCHTDIEIEFYEPEEDDDECSEPHFYCPKCYANYYDRQAKERWIELDSHYEDLNERFRERQFDYDDDF